MRSIRGPLIACLAEPYTRLAGFSAMDVIERVLLQKNLKDRIRFDPILDYGLRKRIFDIFLNGSAKRTRSVRSIVAGFINDPSSNLR